MIQGGDFTEGNNVLTYHLIYFVIPVCLVKFIELSKTNY